MTARRPIVAALALLALAACATSTDPGSSLPTTPGYTVSVTQTASMVYVSWTFPAAAYGSNTADYRVLPSATWTTITPQLAQGLVLTNPTPGVRVWRLHNPTDGRTLTWQEPGNADGLAHAATLLVAGD